MADSIIPRRDMFPKIKEARELLKGRALAMAEKYEAAVDAAIKKGDYDVALKAMQWFILHAPNHEGVTIVDPSVDNPKPDKGSSSPRIQIGIKLGDQTRLPLNQPEAIPAEFITTDEQKPEEGS